MISHNKTVNWKKLVAEHSNFLKDDTKLFVKLDSVLDDLYYAREVSSCHTGWESSSTDLESTHNISFCRFNEDDLRVGQY